MPKAPPLSAALSARRLRRYGALLIGLATLVAGCVDLDTQQRKWIFQASVLGTEDDGAHLAGLQDIYITQPAASKARLHALWAEGPRPDSPVLLFLHGSRRNVESSAFRIRRMRDLGFAVLAIDYRGFGRSSDELPSESSVDEDARAAWAWIEKNHPGRDKYIFGHSLGGAIAIRTATEVDDAKGLIVEGTFTSIPAVFRTMKWGWLPLEPLITTRFDSADRIAQVKVPVLIVHGSDDTLIPPELGEALFEHAKEPKRFMLVEGGTHYSTNSVGEAQYREALHDFFGLNQSPSAAAPHAKAAKAS